MIVQKSDPITGNDVKDLEHAPYIVDGDLKIYFESEESKQAYLDIEVENPSGDLPAELSNPAGMGPGDVRR